LPPSGGFCIEELKMSAKLRALHARKADQIKAAREFNDATDAKAAAENRAWTDEETAQYDALVAAAKATDASIDRTAALEAQEAGMAAAAPAGRGSVDVGAAARIDVSENVANDPKRGFKSQGEFFQAVKGAALAPSIGAQVDPRLRIGAAAPTTYSNEGNGGDGGFAIPPAFSTDIWRLSLEDGSLIPMTLNTEVSGNSMMFPKDETTPWGGTGVTASWKGEATAGTQSKLALGAEMLRLKELMVLVPVTNELLEDAPALGSYLTPLASERIQWKANEAILFGTGGPQPQGCLSSNALVVVAKESGQATATITQPNISKMRSRLLTGQLKNAIWIGQPDLLPYLEGMTVGQIPIFLPPDTGLRNAYDGTLSGRPLMLSEHAAAFSSQSDLSLVSLKGYRTITKAGGIETATSMHLFFDANATAFRFIFRMDGQPVIQAPVTPPTGKSTNTRSFFVTLGAR
jgi:HK97 family phage major capsid protein